MLMIRSRRGNVITDYALATAGEDDVVELDALDVAGLDQLLAARSINVPDDWPRWALRRRLIWLKSRCAAVSYRTAGVPPRPAASVALDLGSGDRILTVDRDSAAETLEPVTIPQGAAETSSKGGSLHLIHGAQSLDENDALNLSDKLSNQSDAAAFRAFIEAEHRGILDKPAQWTAVYRRLANAKVSWRDLRRLDWTRLRTIAPIVTPDTADEWVRLASQTSPRQLAAIVAGRARAESPAHKEPATDNRRVTMSFRVRQDQRDVIERAIGLAKIRFGARIDAVALEKLCANYLSGATLRENAEAIGLEACLQIVQTAYPDAAIAIALDGAESNAA